MHKKESHGGNRGFYPNKTLIRHRFPDAYQQNIYASFEEICPFAASITRRTFAGWPVANIARLFAMHRDFSILTMLTLSPWFPAST